MDLEKYFHLVINKQSITFLTILMLPQTRNKAIPFGGLADFLHSEPHVNIVFSLSNEVNGRKKKKGGRVPLKLIDFALSRCTKYIKYREHADIDLSNEVGIFIRR